MVEIVADGVLELRDGHGALARSRRQTTASAPHRCRPNADAVLRKHHLRLLETRMALGLGKPVGDTLLFAEADGSPRRSDQLSWLWRSACKSLKLPQVSLHALRHTHASALIAGGV